MFVQFTAFGNIVTFALLAAQVAGPSTPDAALPEDDLSSASS